MPNQCQIELSVICLLKSKQVPLKSDHSACVVARINHFVLRYSY